jgi:hypothetical protein
MDFLDKVEDIKMINLLILYNTNLMPLTICALPLLIDLEQ